MVCSGMDKLQSWANEKFGEWGIKKDRGDGRKVEPRCLREVVSSSHHLFRFELCSLNQVGVLCSGIMHGAPWVILIRTIFYPLPYFYRFVPLTTWHREEIFSLIN